ncbi:DUF4249 domain-containing protein [Arenibacter sp. F26102]|uniref:DUF4249 family protein n=1 Tax=Arenibacter sp. F26102 TaxID=2926416 RepID=UPI001FF3C980|nr:DUF4249 family protein [Arenibacter sp. F26102]MCK0147762.1 DUF4249 domain-containing protein [Arenibacter sp. F26102]
MKNILFLIVCFLTFGCQDVIEVDLPTEEPRLVIDALIKLEDMDNPSVLVQIKASLTSSFFEEVQPTQLQEITLRNTESEAELILIESIPGTGVYENEWDLNELTQGNLELHIKHNSQTYSAKTKYVPAVPIESLEQGTTTLFGNDETEVVVTFTDNGERDDFYLFDFDFGEYLVTEDEFYQGKRFQFSFFYDSKIEDEREVIISILGIDKDFFNYMNQLISQSGPDTGPFSTPATTVKGNIINITGNSDSSIGSETPFALGYFAVCQTFSDTLLIKK